MHKCKYCGATLSKLDKDICPFCGHLKPLDGNEAVTEDITKALQSINEEEKVGKPKSRTLAAVLAILFGIFGVNSFYLGYIRSGFITLILSIAIIGGVGSALYFTNAMHNALAFLLPYFVLESIMVVFTLYYLLRHDLKDAKGEFLR